MKGSTWQLFRALCRSSSERGCPPSWSFWGVGQGTDAPNPALCPESGRVGISQANPALGLHLSNFLGVLTHPKRFGGPHHQVTRAQPPLLQLSPATNLPQTQHGHAEGWLDLLVPFHLPNCTSQAKLAGNDASRGEDAPSAPQKQRAAPRDSSLVGITSVGTW